MRAAYAAKPWASEHRVGMRCGRAFDSDVTVAYTHKVLRLYQQGQ